ncbi:MAG: M23 family metallopeptidase, partial [Actinobacteria bacterium]
TIDHGGGLSSTYSWLSEKLVRKGDRVLQGQPVASTGWGHPGAPIPHLHLGVKLDGAYVDPLSYLGPISLATFVRLAPFG